MGGGDRPALKDLVEFEEPVVIDLFCYEDIADILEEEEVESMQVVPPDPYDIVTMFNTCGLCHAEIAFSVRAFKSGIRSLQQHLLTGTLQFLCFDCISRSHHGQ